MTGTGPRYSSTALAVCLPSAALLGGQVCAGQTSTTTRAGRTEASMDASGGTDAYVEEVIVTAERLKKGAMPTQTVIVQTYNALRRGKRLYNLRRYKEALPHLLGGGEARLQMGPGDGGRHLPPWARRRPAEHRVGNGMARRSRSAADGTGHTELLPPSDGGNAGKCSRAHRGRGRALPRAMEQSRLARIVPPHGRWFPNGVGPVESAPEQAHVVHFRGRGAGLPRALVPRRRRWRARAEQATAFPVGLSAGHR